MCGDSVGRQAACIWICPESGSDAVSGHPVGLRDTWPPSGPVQWPVWWLATRWDGPIPGHTMSTVRCPATLSAAWQQLCSRCPQAAVPRGACCTDRASSQKRKIHTFGCLSLSLPCDRTRMQRRQACGYVQMRNG
eukprot:357844-Chlamydomonas_euryale.AAC.2